MTYRLIKKLISEGKTTGLMNKVDLLYTCGRLTDEQYMEIVKLLEESEEN